MSKKVVIFVDDEPLIHRLIKMKFRREINEGEFELISYYDGEECLGKFLDGTHVNVDNMILFSDISMPKLDGINMSKEILGLHPGLDLYLISSLSMDEYKEMAKGRLDVTFFKKPLDFSKIEEIILNK